MFITMKKQSNLWLMAALVCGLSLGITSCKDDDDNELSEKEKEEQVQQALEQQALDNARLSVLDQLANMSASNADYLNQTFEPTIGMVDANDANTRIVNTNTMEAAAERFANLVDASIDENTPSYTWTDEKLGTMTYTKSSDGKSWATVDVNIKQIPHLQKIIYRSPEQADNNGKFSGRAYYRFGDVIYRPAYRNNNRLEGTNEYWICVRPAFGPEGKETSHWACVNFLPDENIFKYEYQDDEWRVPTGLGDNKEHMQNLAELLCAMLFPEEWDSNVRRLSNAKLPMFHDFDRAKVEYHNQFFWKKVCENWDEHELWGKVFNTTKEDLKKQLADPKGGLRLLYNGYSWYTKMAEFLGGWNCTLWEATYTNGTGAKANMHNAQYSKLKHSMKDIDFDCRVMGKDKEDYIGFFDKDNKMRWCVRIATDVQLGSHDWLHTTKDCIAGTYDEYIYYDGQTSYKDLEKDPEITGL